MAKKNSKSSLVKKVFNHFIVRSLLILIIIVVIIFYGTLVMLRHYTHHGEALTVPDIRGLTLPEAAVIMKAQKLRWQLYDSVYITTEKPGVVINQNPEPGSKVKENRNVFLIINAFAPEKVRMPDVVDLSLRQAKSTLEKQGLRLGKLTYTPHIAKDYVLSQLFQGQEISKGTEIVKGSEIELVLGGGLSDEKTNVPNIIGNSLPEARETLIKYLLNFGVIIYDNTVITSADTVNALIFQQRPPAVNDALLQLGSGIDVWLTVDETKIYNSNIDD